MENKKNSAKQFMPFDALSTYKDELKKKEIVKEIKPELSIDDLECLNEAFNNIKIKKNVKIRYFSSIIKEVDGIVTKLNYYERYVKINNKIINFDDIISIEIKE